MIRVRDHKTSCLIDPWGYLGPRRRRLLDTSWAGLFREHILPVLPVRELSSCYTEGFGRPSKEIYAALGALVLQQMHDLTDEETVSQFSFNLQWHYALDIPGESDEAKYLCAKTLWTLRQMVTRRGLDRELFTATTEALAKVFRVDTSRQRIDSVHIRSNMRRLGRVCIFSRSIHTFLVNLRRRHRPLFDTIERELVDRYLTKKALGCFSLVKPSESSATLETVSRDLLSLVERFRDNKQVLSLTSFGVLLRVLEEQCDLSSSGEVTVKASREIASSSLQNPSDPDAGYNAHKGQGYQVQVMETYCASSDSSVKDRTLNLITHVDVDPAHVSDVHALLPALEATKERGLAPEEVLADSLYGSDENQQKSKELGVEVVSPVMGAPKEGTVSLADFPMVRGTIVACPKGHAPVKYRRGKKNISVAFASEQCDICPLREHCPVRPGKKRHYLRFTFKALRIAERRVRERSPEFQDAYRRRAGIESTFSEMDRKTGIKRLRVRGLPAVSCCARLKAIGVNIFRAARVKRTLDDLRTAPKTAWYAIGSIIMTVKERFMSTRHWLNTIFNAATESRTKTCKNAA